MPTVIRLDAIGNDHVGCLVRLAGPGDYKSDCNPNGLVLRRPTLRRSMSVVSAPPVAVLEHNVEYEVTLKVADELALVRPDTGDVLRVLPSEHPDALMVLLRETE